ncbi:MAG: hypothetical protein AAF355_04830 [Myxococcota bacterium]
MIAELQALDRRWLFLSMALAIVLPLLFPIGMEFSVSPMVRAIFDEVESLPPKSTVMISVDYDPAAQPELEPFTRGLVRHVLSRGCRLVFVTLWDKAPPIVLSILREVVDGEYVRGRGYFEGEPHPDYSYGDDYVFLGFKEGKQIVINGMGQNFRQMWPTDWRGTALDDLPVMESIQTLRDFRLIVSSGAGAPGPREYVQQVVARHGLRFAAASTAVSVTDLTPYYPNQIFGLVGGMRGSAEYEQLLGYAGQGTAGLNVLTFGQLLTIGAILLGNVLYFLGLLRARRRR